MLNTDNYMQTERTDCKVKIDFRYIKMGKKRSPQFRFCPLFLPQTTNRTYNYPTKYRNYCRTTIRI